MKTVTLYHSVVCPRCHFSRLMLKQVLKDFPDIQVERKELFSNMSEAKAAGARTIPALVAGDKVLRGSIFTPGKLREFFSDL